MNNSLVTARKMRYTQRRKGVWGVEQYDRENFESVIAYMRRRFGTEIFREPARMYSVFCDLSPELKHYGNVFRQLSERGVFALPDRLMMKAKVRHVLENELFIGAERVDYFLGALGVVYGEAETPRPVPLPVVAKKEPERKAKPSPPPAKIIKRGKCGDNVDFTLDENGVLTISGTGPMWDFKWNNQTYTVDTPWRDERKTISHGEIQNGVTTIGERAFYRCEGLTSVTIPDSVISIGDRAFFWCAGLTSVTIPDSVTTIGDSAFSKCAGLTSVTIPDSVTSIGNGAFHECIGLTSVTIPDSVTSIGDWAFENCAKLTSVTIPDSVTKIGWHAFYDCDKLISVSVPRKAKMADNAFPDTVRIRRRA